MVNKGRQECDSLSVRWAMLLQYTLKPVVASAMQKHENIETTPFIQVTLNPRQKRSLQTDEHRCLINKECYSSEEGYIILAAKAYMPELHYDIIRIKFWV